MSPNWSVADVQEKHSNCNKTMPVINDQHLMFLDEIGININFTRLYARAVDCTLERV